MARPVAPSGSPGSLPAIYQQTSPDESRVKNTPQRLARSGAWSISADQRGLFRAKRERENACIREKRYLDEVGNVHGHLLDLGAVELLNLSHHADILGGNEVDGNTLTTETTTTTDTVDVVLAVGGEVVVDDQGNLLDVDTTGQEVGGDQDTRRSGTELLHNQVTLSLVHVTENDLGALGEQLEDVVDLLGETTLERKLKHLVGLVEDEHLHAVGLEEAALDHVVDTARGTDNDLGTVLQGLHVVADAGTADAGVALNVHEVTDGDNDLLNLLSKLTGRGEDEGLAGLDVGVNLLEDRDGERGSLASTGLSLGNDIVA
ncbi:hypothetical protein ColTof4_08128 [Colletotrichum tofieldiae]|nr:hypothetical protein ColTof3_02350 [Colletotrichum tofieldiae]GKT75705.1 hypothetical protein ColTof4_08128 [Colletotrichum tofieldiae]